jgi:hypothetical protein
MSTSSIGWRPARHAACLATCVVLAALVTAPLHAQRGATRVIAIGDIHGSFDGLTAILQRTGLIDERLHWSGGRSILAQTGDYTDRGPDVRKVMDLLMRLEQEARKAGGQAVVLLGNHEVMNLIGDWRDVTPEICATFATAKSEARREDAWRQYERMAQARARASATVSPLYTQSRDEWMAAHPPGCLEYRDAFAPRGTYGRWLRAKDIAARVDDSLFMHAGINPSRPPPTLAEINERARAEIRRIDTHRQRLVSQNLAQPSFTFQQVLDASVTALQAASDALAAAKASGADPPALDLPFLREAQAMLDVGTWSLVDPEGPLWFRGYAQWPEEESAAQVNALLDHLKVARIVVGHTPTRDRRILTRYGGRVALIDSGMLASAYKGNPSALEITGGRMKAIYPDREVELPATTPPAAAALRHRQ